MGLNEKFFKSADEIEPFFNTVLYDGQNTDLSVTGVGFTPDLVWIKCRDVATNHHLSDSVRGGTKTIFSNLTNSESSYPSIETIDSDGFTVFGNRSSTNRAGQEYVAWCFKAGGAAVLNQEGDEDSYVSANNDLGFSIVKGDSTATGSDVKTVGHGLDSAPELVIMKNLNYIDDWFVYSSPTGTGKYLELNTTDTTINWFNNMVVNSTEVGMRTQTTGTWSDMIAYCFTSKTGVSKVGSFVGTGAAGKKITLSFEPAWILIKRTSPAGASWSIIDNKRSTDSDKNDYLQANANAIEGASGSGITFDTDGFTFSGASFNANGFTHIYYAIA